MKTYYIVSTSNTGHGAVFTNKKDARDYLKKKPGSALMESDQMPDRIPPKDVLEKPRPGVTMSGRKTTDDIGVYTDGSAIGNPGPGGFGIVLMMDGDTTEMSSGYRHTTNNRMEMMAVMTVLEKLGGTDRPVTIYSDSQYTINGITRGWARSWKKKGWKKSDGKPALNPDLWKRMLDIVEKYPRLTFQWVKGHSGDPMNERADELANTAARGKNLLDDIGYNP